jgi:Ca-activated chloride channel family protein
VTHFTNPHFAEPQWLLLALLGPLVLFALQRYSAWMRRRQLSSVVAPRFAAELARSASPGRRVLKEILLLAAVACAGLALARPQWGEESEKGQTLGDDIVFALDCSRSMLAPDVSPNRLQRAKLAILDFLQRHRHGRVGLVAFAGQAFLQCPLTYDYGAFEDALLSVDDRTIPIPGTDIGRALEEAYRAMEKNERQKLIVLVTDGEDLQKGGVKSAGSLAKAGVAIFTIGVGTAAGDQIQLLNDQGRPELLRDNKGEVVRSRLDETTLREIAQETHAAYYPLGAAGEGLAKVRLALESSSGGYGLGPARRFGVDRFHLFVGAIIVLLVVESLVGTRRWESRD